MLLRRQFLARIGLCGGVMPLFFRRRQRCCETMSWPQAAPPLVDLTGDARTVGARFGQLNAPTIRRHMGLMLQEWRRRGLSERQMIERSQPYRRYAEKFAPHWLEEAEGCAQAAGVCTEHFTAFLAGKYRDLFFVEECTSFFAVGAATADGASLFHKTRDNTAREQTAYIKRIVHSSRPAGFFATADTSDMGVMMMANDRGLAGSADMRGLKEDRPKGRGVMNPYILRLIAERSERCEEALAIIQEAIRDGWYAGGAKSGTRWTFTDRFGTALSVAQNSHREEHQFFRDDVAFSWWGETQEARAFKNKRGKITYRDMNRTAWSPKMCYPAGGSPSVSGMTARVDPRHPADLSRVWFALPAWSVYLPVFPLAQGVARELADGSCYLAACELAKQYTDAKTGKVVFPDSFLEAREQIQSELDADGDKAASQIAVFHGRNQREEAQRVAAEASLSACAKLMAFLRTRSG